VVGFGCKFKLDLGTSSMPLYPSIVLEVGNALPSPNSATSHRGTLKWVHPGTWECVSIGKIIFKKHKFENRPFYASSFGNKQTPMWNCPMYDNLKNLKLSYLN
jgi:hypothetical protein